MRFAICISSYLFPDFVELNCIMVKHVFGSATPILISDDKSVNSEAIEAVAGKYGAAYDCSRLRKSHFAGDLQSILNSIVFARSQNCDVAIKISLRLILLDPTLKDVFTDRFKNHICNLILPSKVRPNQVIRRESAMFSMMPVLTDIILLRASAIEPQELIDHYRNKCTNERSPHASLIEALFMDLVHGKFKDSHHVEDAISAHQPNQPHRFLRKAQNNRVEYLDLAKRLGITGEFQTAEWNQILGVNYHPKPQAI